MEDTYEIRRCVGRVMHAATASMPVNRVGRCLDGCGRDAL